MWRMAYVRLLVLMSVSILVLLGAIETATYVVFSRQVQQQGEQVLIAEMAEPKQTVQHLYAQPGPDGHGELDHHDDARHRMSPLSDESDQNVYVMAVDRTGKTIFQTVEMPVPKQDIVRTASPRGFTVLTAHGQPYRVYAEPYHVNGHAGIIYIFELIAREQHMLRAIAVILWGVGGAGGILVVLLNFWLARRALEPARLAWQTQQAMLLELSHELKTPLATISAIAASEYGAAADSKLTQEIQQATNILDDILYFAQLHDLLQPTSEPVAVSDITEEVAKRLQPLAQARNMTIRGRAQMGIYAMSTPDKWMHLVSILLKNATQHGKAGTDVTWHLTATQTEVLLVVENETEIVTPSRRSGSISGIGLRIAERIVRDMHGRLEQSIQTDGHVRMVVHVPRLIS
ncbi:MAG: HAMP domain-containing histidine kinase [Alicyclobacillus sp.]|nr:HAMP domain-containing histidine kinase [Alicyclobacillus sp.]